MVLAEHNQIRRIGPDDASSDLKSDVSTLSTNRSNLAIPRHKHVLTTVSEEYGRPVRTAVALISDALQDEDSVNVNHSYSFRGFPEPGSWVVRQHTQLLAWRLVSAWLTGFVTGRLTNRAGLMDAAAWFYDNEPDNNPVIPVPKHTLMQVDDALAVCKDSAGYLELLPYVLDPHGPGSRLSIQRDAGTQKVRNRKRTEGSYYTPADVARYMVRNCVDSFDNHNGPPIIFDPACGTGVFLRAALETLKMKFPDKTALSICETALYGTDIDPWVLDATAFVLLSDCLIDGWKSDVSPLSLWHRLRLNLACADALTLEPPRREIVNNFGSENDGATADTFKTWPQSDETDKLDKRVSLTRLFPTMRDTGVVVVGNPPYSTIGHRSDIPLLKKLYTCLGGRASPASEIYPLFVEQMVRLTPNAPSAGTLVLPLSLANNVGNQFAETRSFIEKMPGRWRFAFFDREPHALFGEDVKTRNAILFWHRDKKENGMKIETGPLQKWRSDNRVAMFESIRFTPIVGGIRLGIPKIDGASQAQAYEELAGKWERLEHTYINFRRIPLTQVLENDRNTVFVGATAYNFLNVFMKPPSGALENALALSEHPLHAMDFTDRKDAAAAFAILSSHLVFWWWRTNNDGFHVTKGFLASLPFGVDALSGNSREMLADCGERLWSLIRPNPIISINRGRNSLAYSPNGFNDVRKKIDQILVTLAGLEAEFVVKLQRFTARTIRAEVRSVLNT